MGKGISPVIATILLLLITVSITGLSFTFFQRTTQTITTTSEQQIQQSVSSAASVFSIDTFGGNNIYIRNRGTSAIRNSSLSIYINNEKTDYVLASDIAPGSVSPVQVLPHSCKYFVPGTTIKVIGGGGFSDSRLIDPPSGVYQINVLGQNLGVYCDAVTDGGGWTLVLLNTPYPTPPKPNWTAAINGNTITGNVSNGVTSGFDQLLGLAYWNLIGSTMRLQIGMNPSSINHSATYNFLLNTTNNYSLVMTNESILVNAGGTAQPGIYTYSVQNNGQFTTFDADHDALGANCAISYGNTPWWYVTCWSGSYWGGGDGGGYTNNPYWTDSTSEYFPWGAIWIR